MSKGTSPALVGEESTASVIRRAEELEQSDWSAAIDLLTSVNRASRSDDIEIALARLRHRSSAGLVAQSISGPQPAPGTSPAIGDSRLPETELGALTAADLRAAILDHGCLLVRGAVEPRRVRDLVESIDRTFAAQGAGSVAPITEAQDDQRHDAGTPGEAAQSWWSPLELDNAAASGLGRKWVRGAAGQLLCDSPRMMFELIELYTEMGLDSIVAEFLGSRALLSGNKCTLRRVPLDATGGWHQDGAFLGDGIRAVNLWLALTPCGVEAPGLDIVARRFEGVVETGTGGSYFDWATDVGVVQDAAGDRGIVRPQFDAGDLLLFDELLLHRTAVEPEMTGNPSGHPPSERRSTTVTSAPASFNAHAVEYPALSAARTTARRPGSTPKRWSSS